MRLDKYIKENYSPGAGIIKQLLWFLIGSPLVRCSIIPSSFLRSLILKIFGAKISKGAVLKPGLQIKFPWRLSLGEHVWLGENVWIDNLAEVKIDSHTCISQGVYFCTGNHDWSSPSFDLKTNSIEIASHVWIAAKVNIGPDVKIAEGAVVTLGSTVQSDLEAWKIYSGIPAKFVAERPRSNIQ